MEERNSRPLCVLVEQLDIFSISLFAHGFQRTPAVIFMSLYDLSRVTSLVSLHYALSIELHTATKSSVSCENTEEYVHHIYHHLPCPAADAPNMLIITMKWYKWDINCNSNHFFVVR